MSPFGFGPNDPNDPNSGDENPDFASMMEQVQKQIQEQFEKLGINPAGFVNPLSGMFAGANQNQSLPKETVRETAKKFASTAGFKLIGNTDLDTAARAFELADLWLNEATVFPVTQTIPEGYAISRMDWINDSLSGWQATMEPLAIGLSDALKALLAEATEGQEGQEGPVPIAALAGLLQTFIGQMIATQLGQAIGQLAGSVTSAHDVGLPLLEPIRPALIPENIAQWGADLEIRHSEVFLFHALREGALARLFAHNPWLVSYIRAAIVEYGRGIHIDLEAIQRQAEDAMNAAIESGEFDPSTQEGFNFEISKNIFTPEESPAQKEALTKLETVLALIDGWAEEVLLLAAGERVPSMPQLIETLRRKRASSTPAQELFKTLLGLQVSPRMTREASTFWKSIRESSDVETRDKIWSGILPTAGDLLDPASYLKSTTIPDDLSGLL